MRVVSWNIERGYDLDAVIALLQSYDADVYCLTEVDRWNERTGGVDVYKCLCDAFVGYEGYWAQEFVEHRSVWRRLIPVGGQGGGVHGNVVLSKLPVVGYEEVRLPHNVALTWSGDTVVPELFEPRSGSRVGQVVSVLVEGQECCVVNAHLENWRSSLDHRWCQLEVLLDVVEDGVPMVMGVDANTMTGIVHRFCGRKNVEPELLAGRLAARGLSHVFPLEQVTNRYGVWENKTDWVIHNGQVSVVESSMVMTELSDHALLCVDVVFG